MTTEREPVDESRSLGALQVAEAEARKRLLRDYQRPAGRMMASQSVYTREHIKDLNVYRDAVRATEAARYRGLVEAYRGLYAAAADIHGHWHDEVSAPDDMMSELGNRLTTVKARELWAGLTEEEGADG